MNEDSIQNPFSFIADFEGDIRQITEQPLPEVLPILPLRALTLFPCVMSPVRIVRKSSMQLVTRAYETGEFIGAFCQKNVNTENPTVADLHEIGIAARVVKLLELPDGQATAILQGASRIMIHDSVQQRPYLKAHVEQLKDFYPNPQDLEFHVLADTSRKRAIHYIETNEDMPNEAKFAVLNISNEIFMVNFLCTSLPIDEEQKQETLRMAIVKERTAKLIQEINSLQNLVDMKNRILQQTQVEMNRQQREWFLQQEMKNIQDELGGSTPTKDAEQLRARLEAKQMPAYAKEAFLNGLGKLERINPQSPDYNVELNHLQTILELPWEEYTEDNLNIGNAERVLNHDHYGMEEVKERILEHLAILKLRGDMKSPIICLYGPPGVGKTSLGRSIASALKRKYVRASLGGLHDEAEIRGHRRTYIGAMPGRILKNIIKAGSNNPVFILDEIDKIGGTTVHGDPSSALLEVLDPEQNATFYDNFLELDYDLSKILFIATANTLSTIHPALRDRMEIIDLSGYLREEKYEIAKRHLIPKQLKEHGLDAKQVSFPKDVVMHIIDDYTREAGVRNLERKIADVMRSRAKEVVTNEVVDKKVTLAEISKVLGVPMHHDEDEVRHSVPGVATGLAWTSVGGEILSIEVSLSHGGGRLSLTGNLGEVMKESATIAYEFIKAHASLLEINPDVFDTWNVHVHIPEGATPKDGPSAGITMLAALTSAFTQRKVKSQLAMTGEITLRGRVLPVGGIQEKILAAKRNGVTDLILSIDNERDIKDIKEDYINGLNFHYVTNMMEVIDLALEKEQDKNELDYNKYLLNLRTEVIGFKNS